MPRLPDSDKDATKRPSPSDIEARKALREGRLVSHATNDPNELRQIPPLPREEDDRP